VSARSRLLNSPSMLFFQNLIAEIVKSCIDLDHVILRLLRPNERASCTDTYIRMRIRSAWAGADRCAS